MNKDLHNMDDIFNSAYREFEDDPSPDVWQKINDGLDKKEAESYKKGFIIWKRTALLLLLLLTGFVLYESGIIKTRHSLFAEKKSARVKNNIETTKNTTVIRNNPPAIKRNGTETGEPFIQNNNLPLHPEQENITTIPGSEMEIDNAPTNKKLFQRKNTLLKNQVNIFTKKEEVVVTDISEQPDKKKTNITSYNTDQPSTIRPLNENTSIATVAKRPVKNISLLQPITISDSPLTAGKAGNTKIKKVTHFKPFWMIAPFASYESAGYRLDSDVPGNITNIKHREAPEPSFASGIFITRQFTKHWSLQSGLIYSNTQIGISQQKIYALQHGADVSYKYVTSSGYAYIKPGFGTPPAVGDSLSAAEAKHNLQYVSVPAMIKYTVSKKNLSFSPGAGIAANFKTGAKVETEIHDASNLETVTITKLSGTKSFYWSVVADAEVQYTINKKVAVSLRPSLRYAISPITKNNDVETFPRSFGIGVGVKIKL